MKKTLGLFAAAVVCSAGVLADETVAKPSTISHTLQKNSLGKDAILQIRTDFQNGRYDDFLKTVDASYQEVVENKQILEFAKMRDETPLSRETIEKIHQLQIERAEKISQIIGTEESLFVQKVRSALLNSFVIEGEEFFAQLHQMPLGSGASSDENALIALDVEYDYKVTHVISTNPDVSRDMLVALKMEQIDKMVLLALSFKDESLKQLVENMRDHFDYKLVQSWDFIDMYAMLRAEPLDAGSLEGKIAAILQEHQERLAEME
jgi:hypothetical protein